LFDIVYSVDSAAILCLNLPDQFFISPVASKAMEESGVVVSTANPGRTAFQTPSNLICLEHMQTGCL
jgi:hypothetical protein